MGRVNTDNDWPANVERRQFSSTEWTVGEVSVQAAAAEATGLIWRQHQKDIERQ